MPWITILFIAEKDDPKRFAKVIAALNYCVQKDRFKNFRYEVQKGGEGIRLYSAFRDVAYRRGSYFKKKFGINYAVMYER
jgi:hypothetical protein